ncbi:transglutaminase domain-containing protein [uncultured Polaribacter sp.]|uniref:transglutaminase domain-containing protein n=1 Tax=uncultured Polaribacter sp. TaxID=174711 RepID=UPI0026314DF7|nr:transglutaminase domain-containing protein [uncultured Polaribacter sp.]
MKQLYILFLLISFTVTSQDFSKIDSVIKKYPKFINVENLASKINTDFSTDEEKAKAAFYWLTQNIRYNLKEFYNPKQRSYKFNYSSEDEKEQKLQALKDKLVVETFRNRTGVCEEYAQSFKKLCDLLNIKSEVITGNVRLNANEIGKIKTNPNHAWNAVFINEKWVILDATWAAGYKFNNKWIRKFNNYFYDIPTNKIFKTHLPNDSIWVLRFGRISKEDFYNQPIYTNTFLALNAELISPKQGIIDIDSEKNIELKFKNLDSTLDVFYAMKNMKYIQRPIITSKNNITTLTIKNLKVDTELILFINKKDALHFKIQIE